MTEPHKKRLAVMTSGGDSPGMCGAVRAVVRMAIHLGCDAYCVYEGYEGLVQAGRLIAAKNMILNGIDALIICGGDGSLTGADKFRSEWPSLIEELVKTGEFTQEQVEPYQHLNIVGVVGSIDNDMSGTDSTIGAYSALSRICEMVDYIEATAYSHSRAFVIEVMGRHCGWLALMAGVATGADFIFIPERPRAEDWQVEMCDIVRRHRKLGKRKTIVIIAEGAIDKDGEKITPEMVKDLLADKDGLALDTRITTLGHVQRGGTAVSYDRMLATLQGVEAVKAVLEATPETPTCFIAINENKIVRKNLMEAVKDTKAVASAVQAKDFDRAMSLRDHEFLDQYKSYMMTTNVHMDDGEKVPEMERMKIAFINVGAPAGELPAESGMETIANLIEQYRFDALFLIGGFEAFHAVSQLRAARDEYPSLCIPVCVLPATISNNVPGTEYSLGSDTCLNELVNYCDKIKQSASATRRRVFVIETQGGRSGYVATLAGLTVGASAVYTPEEGITLDMLAADVKHLKEVFKKDRGQSRAGRLLLVNEKASKVYNAKLIADIIREEANERFESRDSIPGHVQQGGVPSPIDRCRAVRLAIKCIQHLESFGRRAQNKVKHDPYSTVVIGIKGASVVFTPVAELEETDTDWPNRRPVSSHWAGLKDIVDILGGRNDYPKPEPKLGGTKAKDVKRGLQ
ncbi:unnamed protein product [Parascedosporium putredinis]|uniref:6-phosphofructokinase n=1 Tax=Parascedosporium putredinis TaxID=1442378 RepID=A0A9P1GUX0_9PEZI|nr:unnamed protein product [Parascedosporium putredinis]CAI7988102.1 unnamed protein product [Parascedosporium putredinis]